ncbi:hypothetical protein [Actinomycetospora sp. NBRC 106375]|uniref:hypothetical protein n=1 Tax=Actinomycetospora sp. NBRC 106375 TaxID=3032207 RepID=UPI002552AC0B|nr:hypothetical protein [Actinomycetospora sp. NBRC 106375]
MLSGDGTLTKAISSHGDVVAYERVGAYPTPPAHPTRPFDEFTNIAPGGFDTLLVSTVLHHEDGLDELLHKLASARAERWIVVENSVTEQAPVALHEFVDLFFTHTLNDFALACPGQHRTVEGWTSILGAYGTVRLHAQLQRVPGIPFSYELFVVETR